MTDRKVGDFDWAKRNPGQQRQYDELMNSSGGLGMLSAEEKANLKSMGDEHNAALLRDAAIKRRNRIAEGFAFALVASPQCRALTANDPIVLASEAARYANALIAELDK